MRDVAAPSRSMTPQGAAEREVLPNGLSVTVLTTVADVERWCEAWEALVARSTTNQVTATPFWLLAWWRIFGHLDGRRLRVGLFFDGEHLVGAAPMLSRSHRYRKVVPFRRVELLGTGESEADEIVSEYAGVIAERGCDERVAEAFAAAVVGGTFGEIDEVVLSRLDGGAPLSTAVPLSLSRRGFAVETVCTTSAPYVPLPATWDEYLASLTSSGRYLVKRSLRDFEAWAGDRARVVRATTPDELEAGKAVLVRLHEQRWRAAGKAGMFASQAFRSFHDRVLPDLLARGALGLSWLCVEERPIAVAYNLVWNNRVQFDQGGRTCEVPKGIRPGIVLHSYAIRESIELRRDEYDFLGGASQYKTQLGTALRPLVDIRAVRPGPRESARQWAERGVGVVRDGRDRCRAAVRGWRLRAAPSASEGRAPRGDDRA
jgi:CelD/BcsL family acetyltransferase involved in cellulose biosynthesis